MSCFIETKECDLRIPTNRCRKAYDVAAAYLGKENLPENDGTIMGLLDSIGFSYRLAPEELVVDGFEWGVSTYNRHALLEALTPFIEAGSYAVWHVIDDDDEWLEVYDGLQCRCTEPIWEPKPHYPELAQLRRSEGGR